MQDASKRIFAAHAFLPITAGYQPINNHQMDGTRPIWRLVDQAIRENHIAVRAYRYTREFPDIRIKTSFAPDAKWGVLMPSILRSRHQALLQAQQDERAGALSEGVAHDFRNLLAVVAANLEILEQQIGNNAAPRRMLRAASHAVHRGARLAQCLVDIGLGQHFDPVKTDANEPAVDVADLLRLTVGDRIDVVTRLCDELWPAYVDPGQLQMALLNLCLNARDAMGANGKLFIETANVSVMKGTSEGIPRGRWIMIKVTDTGTGMEPRVLEQACQPFFTTKKIGNGTGLGLNQVRNFVYQSGGHLRITSILGEGTVVRAYLRPWSRAMRE